LKDAVPEGIVQASPNEAICLMATFSTKVQREHRPRGSAPGSPECHECSRSRVLRDATAREGSRRTFHERTNGSITPDVQSWALGAGDDFNRQRSDRRLLAKGWTPCSDGSASIDMDQHGTATPGQSFRRSGTGTDMMENSMLANRRILVLDLAGALAIPMAAPSYAAPAPTATAAVRASAR